MDSSLKQKTITWIKKTVSQKEALFEKIISSGMRIEGVKIILDDIFNDERVEFSWILTLCFACHLRRNPSVRSSTNRWPYWKKTADMERAFLEIGNEDLALKGNIGNLEAFVESKDVELQYDERPPMVSGMITHDFLKRSNFAFKGEAAKVMKIPVSDVATSKSSVCSVGLPSCDVVDIPNRFMKGTACETTVRLYRLTNNLTCFKNLNGADLIVAIFLLLAKDQTGVDREIFQQCAHLRSCLPPCETYCKAMLPYFAEDTSSRKDLKEIYQMQTMQRINSSFLNEKAAEDLSGITYSLNTDCTKFSPSFLMKAISDFIIGLKLPRLISEYMLAVLKAFSAKLCKLP